MRNHTKEPRRLKGRASEMTSSASASRYERASPLFNPPCACARVTVCLGYQQMDFHKLELTTSRFRALWGPAKRRNCLKDNWLASDASVKQARSS